MKKIWMLLLFLPLWSCNDWLDVTSEKSVTLQGYFKSEEDLERLMVSVFVAERNVTASSWPDVFGYCGLQCDQAGDQEGLRKLDPKDFFRHDESWRNYYRIIYLASLMEENRFRFENVTGKRADYWIAQANFAKAYAYFELARKWGEVPISPGTEKTGAVGKSPVEEVLAEAIRCAEIALKSLPKHEALTDSRGNLVKSKQYASLGTVNTLLANIYAWMGGLYQKAEYWQKAEAYASEVIDGKAGYYDLESTIELLQQNTLGDKRESTETIFSIELNEMDMDWYNTTGFQHYYPGLTLVSYPYLTSDPRKVETDVNTPRITVETVRKIYPENQDQRREKYWYKLGKVAYPESESSKDSIYSDYAFLTKWNEPYETTNPDVVEGQKGLVVAMKGNRVIWRLADLILLRAECRARQNNIGGAVADLDRVRTRAGLDQYSGPQEAELLRKEIFHERERELFGEGQRYYDIVRNSYFREELLGHYRSLADQDVKNGALYLPVATRSFKKNPLMKQNIYWSWQQ